MQITFFENNDFSGPDKVPKCIGRRKKPMIWRRLSYCISYLFWLTRCGEMFVASSENIPKVKHFQFQKC